jgi:prepilin-type processing-associated H-X9-DG protein/prepilin-type N-terminal cleavage/methylation domain-containing protein
MSLAQHSQNYLSSAFTLTEVLVVLAVIAILFAILMPAVSRIQDRAEQTECVSRLRALGVAINLYASENNEYYPTSGMGTDAAGNSPPIPSRLRWYVKVSYYMDGPKPSNPWAADDPYRLLSTHMFNCPFCDSITGIGVYGLNEHCINEFRPLKRTRVREPASFPLLACLGGRDSSGNFRGGMNLNTSAPHIMAREYGWTGSVSGNGPSPNHPGGICNFLFADGHVGSHSVVDPDAWPWNKPEAFQP